MTQATCARCGKRMANPRYCSRACANARHLDGHPAVVAVSCAHCFKVVLKPARQVARYPVSFCDKRCAGHYKKRPKVRQGCELVGPIPRRQIETHRLADGVWLGANCAECGDAFLTRRPRDRFCSSRCLKRNQRRRYKKARSKRIQASANRSMVDVAVVAKRDGWRCHICKRKVTRSTWSLDHLVPLSYGGAHTYANVALAHHRCNTLRGNRGHAQLLLIA